MSKEDYFKYYIQGSDHYLIPKDIFDELYDEMNNWKQDSQKYKEVIDKTKEYIEKCLKQTPIENRTKTDDTLDIEYEYILGILKEVK